jgi:hypothetical protein
MEFGFIIGLDLIEEIYVLGFREKARRKET